MLHRNCQFDHVAAAKFLPSRYPRPRRELYRKPAFLSPAGQLFGFYRLAGPPDRTGRGWMFDHPNGAT